jgi:hypothetical protein
MRKKLTREFYIKESAQKVASKEAPVVFYLYENLGGEPSAQCFIGKAAKPAWQYRFKTEAAREKLMREEIEKVKANEERKAKYKAEKKAKQNNSLYEIGDIYYTSWGYEQTNVEFFQVVGKVGETMLKVREIAKASVKDSEGFMSDSVVAVKDAFIGEAFKCKAGEYIKVGYTSANKWDGLPKYRSWYA